MNFSYKQRMTLVVIIALGMIGLGLVQALTDLRLDEQLSRRISLILMVLAAVVFFGGRKNSQAGSGEKPEDSDSEKK